MRRKGVVGVGWHLGIFAFLHKKSATFHGKVRDCFHQPHTSDEGKGIRRCAA